MLFRKAPLALIQKYYPDYSGPVSVYRLQSHILRKIVNPMIHQYLHPEDTFVDLGCGVGWMVKQFQQKVTLAVGIDEVLSGFHKFPNLNLVQGSLYHLPIQGKKVDCAISLWVFEHLKKPQMAITEIERILKPKGWVLIVAPNLFHPLIMLSRIFPLRMKQRILYALNNIREETVLKTYFHANTEFKLDRLFHQAGFEKVEFHYSDSAAYWLFSKSLFRWTMELKRVLSKFHFFRRFKLVMIALYRKRELNV